MKKSIFFKWVIMLILMIGGNIFTSKVTYAIVDLQIPIATGSYIYNGENQSLELSNFDESLINVTGNVGISAGNYKAILSLINPNEYRWSDGTIDDVIIDWEIEKASTTMEVNMEDFYYGNKKPQPQIIGNTEKAPVKYYYTTTNTNTGGTLWANVQNSTTLDLGTYYMYAVVEESTNYYSVTTEPVEFTISKLAIDADLKTDGLDYNGEWTNKNVQAIIEIPNSIDELTYIYYKTEDMANYEAHPNTTIIENKLIITFDNPIEKDVTFVGVNVAGRPITIETTKQIKIEKRNPKIESVIEEVVENTIKVTATATDAESGIKYYTTTNGEIPSTWIELPNALTTTEINIEVPTNLITYLWVMDAAGNMLVEGEEIIQYKDYMSPEGTIKVMGNEIDGSVYVNNRDVTLEITAKDDTTVSGDLKMKIYEAEEFINLETTENITWDSFKEVVKYNLSEGDGKKTLYLLLRDEAGNISVVIPDNSPERADYKVHYYLENTDNENYTEYKVETKSGMKGSKIEPANLKKRIEGATYVKTTLTPNGAEVEEATINADGSTNIYLYYDRNEYTLTLAKNEYVTSVTGAGTYKYGKAIDISATPLNEIGYTYKFLNWSSNNKEALKDIETPDATIIMPASAITLTAKATKEANEYTVTFDANGGLIDRAGTETITQKIIFGKVYGDIPEATKGGNKFLGWYNETDNQVTAETIMNIAQNHTIKAKWEKVNTLTVNPNGAIWSDTGTSEIRKYIGKAGESLIIPTLLPKDGTISIIFDGNGGKVNGQETYTLTKEYDTVQSYLTGDSKGTYNANTNEYIFADGDDTLNATSLVYFDSNDIPTAERVGYSFVNWNDKQDGSGNIHNFDSYFIEGTIAYAKWEQTMVEYKVQHWMQNIDGEDEENDTNYTLIEDNIEIYSEGALTIVTPPVKDVLGFITPNTQTVTLNEGVSTVINYYYRRKHYTITFNTNGGTAISAITGDYGTTIVAPTAPTKTGYTFVGWDQTIPSTMPAEDMTITAQWQMANSAPNAPTVTFDSKTTSSFKVNAEAIDPDGNNLTYRLYVGDILAATSNATASGVEVTLEATGLSNYTDYEYYVTASDESLTSTSSTLSVRTYCPGTTYTGCGSVCPYYVWNKCEDCNGDGLLEGIIPNSSALNGNCINASGGSGYNNYFETEFVSGYYDNPYCAYCKDYKGGSKIILTCRFCGATSSDSNLTMYKCNTCDELTYEKEDGSTGWFYDGNELYHYCQTCDGEGGSSYCNIHNTATSHYVCTTHESAYLGTNSSKKHCEHGYTSQH